MNRTYSIVYNAALGQYQVASEKTKTRCSKARKLLPIILAGLLVPTWAVDIVDGNPAINVSDHPSVEWKGYIFKTKNPIDANNGTEQFGFAAWSKALKDYLDNPNDTALKAKWDSKNQALKDSVANYFAVNKGFLNINKDKTFTLTASTTQPTEKLIKAGELVAISVGAGKNLTYDLNNPLATLKPEDEPEHISGLFNIEKDGTLIMVGEQGSSITIKGFKVNHNGVVRGAIYNAGNVFLGGNVTLEGNTAFSSSSSSNAISYGGEIYNSGTFSLGDHAKFKKNTASAHSAFVASVLPSSYSRGGAIYNTRYFTLGDGAAFTDNTAFTFSSSGGAYSSGGAIYNNSTGVFSLGERTAFINNTSSGSSKIIGSYKNIESSSRGGAIYNEGILILGNNAQFESNTAASSSATSFATASGGAIYNGGTFNLGDNAKFEGNTASSSNSSYGGAINNGGTFNLGDNAKFVGNTVSSYYSSGGAIYNSGTFNLAAGNLNDITLFAGNLANGQANSIHQNSSGKFNITGDGILDMRDPFSGAGTFNKSGNGVWKLGGDNATKNLNINEGTLYLYAKDEVDNVNSLDATAKVGLGNLDITGQFTLGSGAVLSLGGQGHTIRANSIGIKDNITFRFNLKAAQLNTPILTWDAKSIGISGDWNKVDIQTLAKNNGTYTLIHGLGSKTFNQNLLYIRGESIKDTLLDGVYQLNGTADNLKLTVTNVVNNETVTWNGASDQWNMTDKNWDGRAEKQYLLGDKVVFNEHGNNKNITINAGGVVVSDMVVSGGDYKFSGGVIETTANILGTKITNPQQKLTIEGGAKVDFTGIAGKNNFAGGVFLDKGTLSVSTLNQLGTNLSKMTFGTGAILDFKDSITIDGQDGSDQRLVVGAGQELEIKIVDGKTLAFNSSFSPLSFVGGAINNNGRSFSIGNNAKFEDNKASDGGGAIYNNGRSFSIGNNAKFEDNKASFGGAIYNNGRSFSIGNNATLEDNKALMGGAIYNIYGIFTIGNKSAFVGNKVFNIIKFPNGLTSGAARSPGGAIYNVGTFNLGNDATFIGNSSYEASGGAIYNSGTFNLATGNLNDVTLFRGNLASGQANSIHQDKKGKFNITGDGTLDMRDPFSGEGTFNKSGNSVWKLGGDNTTTNLNINEGTLYLYAKDEEENGNRLDANARVTAGNITVTKMTLGTANNGATLFANGGNKLSGDTLTLYSGSTFGFKVDQNTPAMTWNFKNNIKHEGDENYTFDVSDITSGVGKYHLLSSTSAHGFDKDKLTLNYKNNGQIIGRVKDIAQLDVSLKNIYLIYSQETQNAIATWNNGNPQAIWDSNANHWNIEVEQHKSTNEKFLDKDQVIFGLNNQQQTIEIVNNVIVGDMTVDGGDYKFTNGSITTDKAGVGLSSSTEQLKLINGAKVDFTEITGTNKFANGIDLDNGALTVSNKNQLGTDLSGVKFGTQGTLNLEIADKNTFDATGSLSGAGTVNKQGAGTWQLAANSVNSMNVLNVDLGTLALGNRAEITTTTMTVKAGTVELDNKSKLNATTMTLGSGITLSTKGENKLTGGTLTLNSGSTFKFHISKDNFIEPSKIDTAVMQWGFTNIDNDGGQYVFDISPVTSGVGKYHLLNSTNAHGFDKDKLTLNYQGNTQTIGRLKTSVDLEVELNDIYFNYSQTVQNAIATWANTAQSATWDSNTNHWNIDVEQKTSTHDKFLDKDRAVFDQNTQQQTIDIANTVVVGDMIVDGGDYKFTGKGITTDKTGVGLSNSTEKLMLTNGAKVDFTGITGTNNFTNGIDLDNGALTVSKKEQLGTDLSSVKFSTQGKGTLNLDIAASDTFDAKGSLSGTGTVNKQGSGTWLLDANSVNSMNVLNVDAGTVSLGNKSTMNTTTMTLGTANNGATLFANGGNNLSGDTLKLYSSSTLEFKISKDNFIDASTNSANDSVMHWDFTDINHVGNQQYTIGVSPLIYDIGRYHLLSSQNAHGFDVNKLTLTYLGHDPKNIERIKNTFFLKQDAKNIYLEYGKLNSNGIATWNDASPSGKWNVADENWSVKITGQQGIGKTFLTQDHVIFGQNTNQQFIDITHDVIVAGMDVTEGDYKFTGKGISTANTGVGLSNATEQLIIQNGAKVDFTGITGTNNFANGIDLDVGTLTVSSKNQLGTDLSGIQFGTQGTLNLDITKADTFNAGGLSSQRGTVNKKGAGTWLVDGKNNINVFNLEAGTLALGRNATITTTTMTIGSANQHSNLFMQSNNLLSGNTLNLNSGGVNGSTTFGIKFGSDNYVTPTHNGTAVMNWVFSTIVNDGGHYIWNVETVPSGYGRYYLLNSNVAHNFNQSQLTLEYAGYNPNSIDRIKDSFKFVVDSNNIYLDYSQISPNGIATWADASHSGKWNVADNNWSVQITGQTGLGQTFLTQDHVVFGQNSSQQIIDIANDVIVTGMEVAGDYKFTGQGISTSNAGVGLTNITEQLSINNGATVDFTGITGTNNFANGIDLDNGALTVSNKNQLGTDLSGIQFGAQGILNLDIADKNTFDASGSLSSQQGTVNKKGAGTWQLDGINNIGSLNFNAGTLALGQNAEITTTTMTIGSANQHSKLLMQNGSKLVGDTLSLISGGANGSTTFIMALSANNLVNGANIAAIDWDFKTIQNDGGNYSFDITKMTSGVGQYLLLSNSHNHSFNQNQLKFSYAGFDPNSIERLKDVFKLTADATQVYLDYSQILPNGTATWVNTNGSAVWNVADKNWSVAIPNYSALSETFLNKDAVIFGDLGLADQSINVNAAGSEFELDGMAVNANTNYTFNGDGLKLMTGTEITKQGRGMLAFNNTVTGDVDLQGGSLIIGSSSQNKSAKLAGNVIAQSGTTLGGHGTIEGIANLNQGATLSPGNSIGSLTVGELNLHNGSKVVLDTAPNGDSDKIIAKKLATATGTTSGNITIGQNVTLDIVAGAGQWSPSQKYSFMTAEGVITGAFSNVTTNLAFLTPKLVTGANGAPELVMNRNNITLGSVAKTYNQLSTADAINTLSHGHAVYDAVVSMSDAEARLAYDNLSGELYASTANALFQNTNRLHDGMLSRIHENSTGLWLDGWGYNGEIKGDGNAAKVENKGSGLLLGYDWAMKENILIGAALGYEESKIKIKEHNRKGENSVKSTHLMVYGNVDLDVIELKAGLNYSALRYKANRNINIPTLAGTANAKYRGHQVHAFVEASKTFNITENYDVAPYLNVAYTEITTKDFAETGSKAVLHAQSQNNSRTSITLGVKNDWYLGVDKNLAITADLGWKHTFGDQTIDQRFNFVGSDHSFNIKSASINKNSAVVGLGIKGQHKDFTIDVGYQGEFNSKVKDHALSAKLKWSF